MPLQAEYKILEELESYTPCAGYEAKVIIKLSKKTLNSVMSKFDKLSSTT